MQRTVPTSRERELFNISNVVVVVVVSSSSDGDWLKIFGNDKIWLS